MRTRLGATATLISMLFIGAGYAQTASAPAPGSAAPASQPSSSPQKKFAPRSWATQVEPDPPSYVKSGKQFGLEDMDWLLFGAENRTRYEYRDDDYRRDRFTRDEPFQMRSRGFVGIKDIVDPLRFGLEFVDARQFNSKFPDTRSDVDENDIYQAYGELYFKDALGKGQPIQFDFGRMFLEYVDRRLVSRSRWRSTTDNFDGFRLRLGQPQSDWQFDFFAVQPVRRQVRQFDEPDHGRWFYGLVGAWRKYSNIISLEPYYFILDEDRKDPDAADREIHTMGLRGYGPIADTGFDYDFDAAFQFGDDGERVQRAFASAGEIGYTFNHPWKPRLSWWNIYASGDKHPDDGTTQRFDRLFGDGHGLSTSDLIIWSNIISTKIRVEAVPTSKLKVDAAYGGYWLASDNDAWIVPGRRDPTGASGRFIGQEIELRARYQIDPRLELEMGYSHLFPGPFIRNTGDSPDSDFFYVSTNVRF